MSHPEVITTLHPQGREASAATRWLWGGYVFIGVSLLACLLYIASGAIEPTEDEVY
jgi:hypothetical protein